jgi:hypothetical protein
MRIFIKIEQTIDPPRYGFQSALHGNTILILGGLSDYNFQDGVLYEMELLSTSYDKLKKLIEEVKRISRV